MTERRVSRDDRQSVQRDAPGAIGRKLEVRRVLSELGECLVDGRCRGPDLAGLSVDGQRQQPSALHHDLRSVGDLRIGRRGERVVLGHGQPGGAQRPIDRPGECGDLLRNSVDRNGDRLVHGCIGAATGSEQTDDGRGRDKDGPAPAATAGDRGDRRNVAGVVGAGGRGGCVVRADVISGCLISGCLITGHGGRACGGRCAAGPAGLFSVVTPAMGTPAAGGVGFGDRKFGGCRIGRCRIGRCRFGIGKVGVVSEQLPAGTGAEPVENGLRIGFVAGRGVGRGAVGAELVVRRGHVRSERRRSRAGVSGHDRAHPDAVKGRQGHQKSRARPRRDGRSDLRPCRRRRQVLPQVAPGTSPSRLSSREGNDESTNRQPKLSLVKARTVRWTSRR